MLLYIYAFPYGEMRYYFEILFIGDKAMRRCQLTGKKALVGYKVSHSHRRSKKRQQPNLQSKRIWDPDKRVWLKLKISTSAIRTLDKIGFRAFMRKYDVKL